MLRHIQNTHHKTQTHTHTDKTHAHPHTLRHVCTNTYHTIIRNVHTHYHTQIDIKTHTIQYTHDTYMQFIS